MTTFEQLRHRHLNWLRSHNYAERTIETRERHLLSFIEWLAARSIDDPKIITLQILEQYQRHIHRIVKVDGQPLSSSSQRNRLVPIRTFFKWMVRQQILQYNPTADMEMPREEQRIPRVVLTPYEAEVVLSLPDINTSRGIHDRAMLEVFYSTGIRRTEMAELHLKDLDHDRGTLLIRQGKGKKDRLIPIGARALRWVVRYVEEHRPDVEDVEHLFLNKKDEPWRSKGLSELVSRYVREADIDKDGSCHLFRHSMATSMLDNGADLRFIQQMLGHAHIATTQVYTRVSIKKLQEVHGKTHPTSIKSA